MFVYVLSIRVQDVWVILVGLVIVGINPNLTVQVEQMGCIFVLIYF